MTQSSDDIVALPADTADLSESDQHRLLSSNRRRLALAVLSGRTPPVDLEDIALAVARREAGGNVSDERVDRIASALHHTHLPMMADLSVVDYDPATTRIEFCPGAHDR